MASSRKRKKKVGRTVSPLPRRDRWFVPSDNRVFNRIGPLVFMGRKHWWFVPKNLPFSYGSWRTRSNRQQFIPSWTWRADTTTWTFKRKHFKEVPCLGWTRMIVPSKDLWVDQGL